MAIFKGTYGINETPCNVFYWRGWYAVENGLLVNYTPQTLFDGVNVELIDDLDVFTLSNPVSTIEQFIEIVDRHERENDEQFNDWLNSDNVIKTGENQYKEHSTQWRKVFTLDELRAFFEREYLG